LTYYFKNEVSNKKELSEKNLKKEKKIKRKKKKVKIKLLKVSFKSNIKVSFKEEKDALIASLIDVDHIIAILTISYVDAQKQFFCI